MPCCGDDGARAHRAARALTPPPLFAPPPKHETRKHTQERKAAVIRAEGESESARLISEATRVAGAGIIELRRIEAAKAIADTLGKSGTVVYLPGGNNQMLLGLNPR